MNVSLVIWFVLFFLWAGLIVFSGGFDDFND